MSGTAKTTLKESEYGLTPATMESENIYSRTSADINQSDIYNFNPDELKEKNPYSSVAEIARNLPRRDIFKDREVFKSLRTRYKGERDFLEDELKLLVLLENAIEKWNIGDINNMILTFMTINVHMKRMNIDKYAFIGKFEMKYDEAAADTLQEFLDIIKKNNGTKIDDFKNKFNYLNLNDLRDKIGSIIDEENRKKRYSAAYKKDNFLMRNKGLIMYLIVAGMVICIFVLLVFLILHLTGNLSWAAKKQEFLPLRRMK